MQQPKRPHVLQEWIVPVLAKNGVAEPRRLVPDTLRRPSNSGHLRPEPDGAHHVLADAQNHHGTLVVGERGRIAHEGSMRLRQPRIANWKRLVPRKPHSVSSIPSRWGRRSRPSPAAPRVRHAETFPPPPRSPLPAGTCHPPAPGRPPLAPPPPPRTPHGLGPADDGSQGRRGDSQATSPQPLGSGHGSPRRGCVHMTHMAGTGRT